MSTINFSVRMDSDLKNQSEKLFNDLGMNLTTAINVFLRQSLRYGGFPFEIRLDNPNQETREAIQEVQKMRIDQTHGKTYTDVDQMMKELLESGTHSDLS